MERKLGRATRDAYGDALIALGKSNDRIVVLDADLSKSTKSGAFGKAYPERFFNFGIQEANMIGAAAGMASAGCIPFASSFATFLMCKGFDQIRMGIANPHLNVKLVGSHAGISIGEDGASQMGVEDVALACAVPGMAVLVPADEMAAGALTHEAARYVGPVFLRTGRAKAPLIYGADTPFPVGKAHIHKIGKDCTIIANGLLVFEALEAAELAGKQGLDVGVIDMYCVKPLDADAVEKAARASGALVVAEEHLHSGALGAAVAQAASQRCPALIEYVDLGDKYAESGTPEALLEKYGMTSKRVLEAVVAVTSKKKTLSAV